MAKRELSPIEKIMLGYGAIQNSNASDKEKEEVIEVVTKQPETRTFGEMLQATNPRSNINAHLNISNGYATLAGEKDPQLHKDARTVKRLLAEREALDKRMAEINEKYK
ncbi:hypothetical protein ACT7C1_29085 [Bacillus paranthracis]